MTDNKDLMAGSKGRNLEETLDEVGEFVQVALPVLMELVRKGCRFTAESIGMMRPSFQVRCRYMPLSMRT